MVVSIAQKIASLEKKLKKSAPKVPALIKNIVHLESLRENRGYGCHWVYAHHHDANLFDDPDTGGLLANSFNYVGFDVFHRASINTLVTIQKSRVAYLDIFKSIHTVLNYNHNDTVDKEVMQHLRVLFKSSNKGKLLDTKCDWNNDNESFEKRYAKFSRFMINILGIACWTKRRVAFFTHYLHTEGKQIEEYRVILHNLATSHFNQEGRIFSIAVGDMKYSTGFSIYNVLSIHVLEAPPNYADWLQSIARGVRMCGDYRLLQNQTNDKSAFSRVVPYVFTYIYDSDGSTSRESKILRRYLKQANEFTKLNTFLKNKSTDTLKAIKNDNSFISTLGNYNIDNLKIQDLYTTSDESKKFHMLLKAIIGLDKSSLYSYLENIYNNTFSRKLLYIESLIPKQLINIRRKKTGGGVNGKFSNSNSSNSVSEVETNNSSSNTSINNSSLLTKFSTDTYDYKITVLALISYIRNIMKYANDHPRIINNIHRNNLLPSTSDVYDKIRKYIYNFLAAIIKRQDLRNVTNNDMIKENDIMKLYKKINDFKFMFSLSPQKILNGGERMGTHNASHVKNKHIFLGLNNSNLRNVISSSMCSKTNDSIFYRIATVFLNINRNMHCSSNNINVNMQSASSNKSENILMKNVSPALVINRQKNKATIMNERNNFYRLFNNTSRPPIFYAHEIKDSLSKNKYSIFLIPYLDLGILINILSPMSLNNTTSDDTLKSMKEYAQSVMFMIHTPSTKSQAIITLMEGIKSSIKIDEYATEDAIIEYLSQFENVRSVQGKFSEHAHKQLMQISNGVIPSVVFRYIGVGCAILNNKEKWFKQNIISSSKKICKIIALHYINKERISFTTDKLAIRMALLVFVNESETKKIDKVIDKIRNRMRKGIRE